MIYSTDVSGWHGSVLNEMRCLAGLMEFPEAFVMFDWEVDFFDDTLNRLVCEQVLLLAESNKPFDRISVNVEVSRLNNVDLSKRVLECWEDRSFSLVELAYWHGLLKRLWAERVIRLTGQDLYDNPERRFEAIEILEGLNSSTEDVVTVQEDFAAYREKRKSGEQIISTGEGAIDRLLDGGWQTGLYGVAARMKQGKSMVLLHFARKTAETGRKVLFVSYEMTKDQVNDRLLASVCRIDSSLIAKDELDFEVEFEGEIRWARDVVDEARSRLPKNLIVQSPADRTVGDLRNLISKASRKLGGLDAVFVDYAQIMTYKGRYSSKQELNSILSNQLANLAMRFELPVISALQLKRPEGVRENKIPDAADIAESDQYARDAVAVFYIIRSRMPEDGEFAVGSELLLKLGTSRFGANGSARFKAEDKFSTITYLP